MTSKIENPAKAAPCVIGTAGHIDHGKTSLVKALTGMDTDRLPEEKKRGISIDLGFAHMDFDDAGSGCVVKAAFVDVPGHERFIKNMLAGATGMNFVLFAIAADDGVMPQTTEHLDVVRLLGVKKGIFVITKTDLASPERVDDVKEKVEGLIKNTALSGSPVIGVSTVTGAGMDELRGLIKKHVFSAPVASGAAGAFFRLPPPDALFRLPIDRVFALKGFGTVVTGTIASGGVRKGDELVLFPSGKTVRVRGIETLHTSVDEAGRGERAALNLAGISHSEIGRGDVAASQAIARYLRFALEGKPQYVDALFELVEGTGLGPEGKKRPQLRVHHLTSDALCRVSINGVNKDGLATGRLILKKPLLMLRGDRFIIRDVSRNVTIGGGTVVIPYFSRAEAAAFKTTGVFDVVDVSGLAATLIKEAGFLEVAEAALKLNVKEDFLTGLARREDGGFKMLGEFIVDTPAFSALEKKALDVVSEHRRASPMDAGMSEDAFINAMKRVAGRPMPQELSRLFLEDLSKRGMLKRAGAALSLSGISASEPHKASEIEKALAPLIPKGFTAASSADIMKLPFKKSEIEKTLGYLQRTGAVVRLTQGSFISGAAIKEARAMLGETVKAKGGITAAEFRNVLGCGRKLAIEILEYFDRERVTLRKGDARILR